MRQSELGTIGNGHGRPFTHEGTMDGIGGIIERLDRIERLLLDQKSVKDWYSTTEVAEILGRTPYTVREWCRHGEVRAEKRCRGRGAAKEWVISHAELVRIRNEGLLPLRQ